MWDKARQNGPWLYHSNDADEKGEPENDATQSRVIVPDILTSKMKRTAYKQTNQPKRGEESDENAEEILMAMAIEESNKQPRKQATDKRFEDLVSNLPAYHQH